MEEKPQYIKPTIKGWDRLLFDLGDQKVPVVIKTLTGEMHGSILQVEHGIVVFQENTDRYRKNISYVPIHNIQSISSNFE